MTETRVTGKVLSPFWSVNLKMVHCFFSWCFIGFCSWCFMFFVSCCFHVFFFSCCFMFVFRVVFSCVHVFFIVV